MWFGFYRVIGGNTRVMIDLNVQLPCIAECRPDHEGLECGKAKQ